MKQDNQPQGRQNHDRNPEGGAARNKVAPATPCPVCGKPAIAAHDPFCSARCADVDLNRWLTGSYAIPGRPVVDDETED
ncbi:DNA gyrase inhibitor YacG [Camelimonas sp. ID_303_24]